MPRLAFTPSPVVGSGWLDDSRVTSGVDPVRFAATVMENGATEPLSSPHVGCSAPRGVQGVCVLPVSRDRLRGV